MTEGLDRGLDLAPTANVYGEREQSAPAGDAEVMAGDVVAALRSVHDPEIPVNIYDLGLIYRLDVRDQGLIEIDMTLTAPGCPVAGEILSSVKTAVHAVAGVGAVHVNLVFDPPWDQSRMSDEAKLELGFL
jgi:FeS assembly SUF system protein